MPALTTVLRCPSCRAAVRDGDGRVVCDACGSTYRRQDGWIDLLEGSASEALGVESDYEWDYRHDRRISPFTLARWRLLAERHAAAVLRRPRPLVVSVGGGGENWLVPFLDGRVGGYVVVEPSEAQLRSTRVPTGAEHLLLRAAAEDLPLLDASVDVAELHSVLDHFTDPALALAEVRRVVRPGGLVTVTIGNDGSWYRTLAGRLGVNTDDDHAHAGHYDVAGVQAALLAAGLEPDEASTIGYLRLPTSVERLAGRAGEGLGRGLVRATDRAGRRLAGPHAGGMLLVTAVRP